MTLFRILFCRFQSESLNSVKTDFAPSIRDLYSSSMFIPRSIYNQLLNCPAAALFVFLAAATGTWVVAANLLLLAYRLSFLCAVAVRIGQVVGCLPSFRSSGNLNPEKIAKGIFLDAPYHLLEHLVTFKFVLN